MIPKQCLGCFSPHSVNFTKKLFGSNSGKMPQFGSNKCFFKYSLLSFAIWALKILEKFLKLILKTKETSFWGQNLVKMSLFWVIRAFLKYSCPQLCFLIVPQPCKRFRKNPTERDPWTKWTNFLGQNWSKMPYITMN